MRALGQELLVVRHQLSLAALDASHLRLQLLDLINLPLPTVLGGHLVLASPSDISTQGELLLGQLVLGEQVVELVHGEVDDVRAGDGEPQILRLIRSGIKNDPNLEMLFSTFLSSLVSVCPPGKLSCFFLFSLLVVI